jgi:hypothetical protein
MPNPWESSSFQLKSTLNSAGASLVPPARLADVMLLREWSSWQARLHDKFEEFTQGFDGKFEAGDAESQPQQACFRLAPGAVSEGTAAELSNRVIAQLCRSVARPTPGAPVGSRNSPVQEMFPDIRAP